jgi:hypothetical protein
MATKASAFMAFIGLHKRTHRWTCHRGVSEVTHIKEFLRRILDTNRNTQYTENVLHLSDAERVQANAHCVVISKRSRMTGSQQHFVAVCL